VRPFLAAKRRVQFKHRAKVLISPDFRRLARQLPVVGALYGLASSTFHRLSEKSQNRIRERLQWPISLRQSGEALPMNSRFVTAQIRAHYHSPNKLATQLGWKPPLNHEAGMETIAEWFKFAGLTSG